MVLDLGPDLERYTRQHPREVLLVELIDELGEVDQVMVYRGFSSSLVRSTPDDPDLPVVPAQARVRVAHRLLSPYDPHHPNYIQANLTPTQLEQLLSSCR